MPVNARLKNPDTEVPERGVYTAVALAGLLEVDRYTVYSWIEEGCPTVTRGEKSKGTASTFRMADVVSWLRERDIEEAAEKVAAKASPEIDTLKAEALRVRIARDMLRLGAERKDLIERDAARQLVATEYAAIRRSLLSLPASIALRLGLTEDQRMKVADAVNGCLEQLSADRRKVPVMTSSEESGDADEG